jgi:hypothetical protein
MPVNTVMMVHKKTRPFKGPTFLIEVDFIISMMLFKINMKWSESYSVLDSMLPSSTQTTINNS